MNEITALIFEIRFRPTPKILDKRGEITESLADENLSEWKISQDKIELRSKTNKTLLAVFQYNALTFIDGNVTDTASFSESAKAFCRKAWLHFPTNAIGRIGMRTIFLKKIDNFDDVLSAYKSNFLGLSDAVTSFGDTLVDVGTPLNFTDGSNFFDLKSGPMKREQSKSIFDAISEDEVPENGIFIDVDYYSKEPSDRIKQNEVLSLIDTGIQKAEQVKEKVLNLVLPPTE